MMNLGMMNKGQLSLNFRAKNRGVLGRIETLVFICFLELVLICRASGMFPVCAVIYFTNDPTHLVNELLCNHEKSICFIRGDQNQEHLH